MTIPLVITTLGGWSVEVNGGPLPPLHSRKAEALLAYLATTRRPQQRAVLADLLWDDRPSSRALANLSVLLNSLRVHLAPFLQVTRQHVAFVPGEGCRVDVAELEAALDGAAALLRPDAAPSPAACMALESAIAGYGEFLHGLYIRGAAGFEEWQRSEQERLRGRILALGTPLLKHQHARRAHQAGMATAMALLRLDPYHDEINRLILLHAAAVGQRGLVLEHYQRYSRLLAEDLGTAPAPECAALAEQLLAGGLATTGFAPGAPAPRAEMSAPIARGFPQPATSMVGREPELRQLAERLAAPACRLITLIGPGGSGKTRLALQAALHGGHAFADGVCFVDLAPLNDASLLPFAIAVALGLSQSAQGASEQLLSALAERRMLLVLDNFEQLLSGADFVVQLLAATRETKLLITSRAPLELGAEWLVVVDGLEVPPPDVPHEALLSFAAVRLFVQRALQARPDFALTPANGPAVAAICRRVDGLPLAVELAAAQLRQRDLGAIAAGLETSFDLLVSGLRDAPERQRSVRAVFESSQALLAPPERALLRTLAVFHGSFDAAAAAAVTGGACEGLAALQRASLLRRKADGSYSFHELVRQFAVEALALEPAEEAGLQERHARYYAGLVAAERERLHREPGARAVVALALDNLRAAWSWSAKYSRADLLATMAPGLSRAFGCLGQHEEGARSLRLGSARLWAAANLSATPDPTLLRAALVVLFEHVELLAAQERYAEAQQQLDVAHEWLSAIVDEELHLRYALLRGFALHPSFDCRTIVERLRPLVAQARAVGNLGVEAEMLRVYGVALWFSGNTGEAWPICEQALERYRRLDDRVGVGHVVCGIGYLLLQEGHYERARRYLEESLQVYRQFGNQLMEAHVLQQLASIAWEQGRFALAIEHCAEASRLYAFTGNQRGVAVAQGNLGDFYRDLRDSARAEVMQQQALRRSRDYGERELTCWSLIMLAAVRRDTGDYEAAHCLLQQAEDVIRTAAPKYKLNAWALIHRSLLERVRGETRAAVDAATLALEQARQDGDRSTQGLALTALGLALEDAGEDEGAAEALAGAAAIRQQLGQPHLLCEVQAAQARLLCRRGEQSAALALVQSILNHLDGATLDGTEEPARIRQTCSAIMQAAGAQGAAELPAGSAVGARRSPADVTRSGR